MAATNSDAAVTKEPLDQHEKSTKAASEALAQSQYGSNAQERRALLDHASSRFTRGDQSASHVEFGSHDDLFGKKGGAHDGVPPKSSTDAHNFAGPDGVIRIDPTGKHKPGRIEHGTDLDDGSTFERKNGKNGAFSETHTGLDPELKYSRSDDGKGTTKFTAHDKSGFVKTDERVEGLGHFAEHHFGPKETDRVDITGDNTGNRTETRSDGQGGKTQKFTRANPDENHVVDTHKDGTKTITDATGLKVEMISGSEGFQGKMYGEIESLPKPDRKLLADWDKHFAVGNMLTDIDHSLEKEKPRNHPAGTTFNDIEGVYINRDNAVAIAERTTKGVGDRPEGVIRHEAGHGVDSALGDFSHSREFEEAYKKDSANMSGLAKIERDYLASKQDHSGQEETFAEVYGAMNGSSANPSETRKILATFPTVQQAIRKRLNEAEHIN